MENYNNWEKIAKHLLGEESEEEKRSFLQWLNEEEANKEQFKEGEKLWEVAGQTDVEYSPNLENAWARFQQTVDQDKEEFVDEKPVYKLSSSIILKIAAVFLVTFGLGYIVMTNLVDQDLEIGTALKETKEIVLPDGTQVWLNENSKISYSEDFDVQNRIVNLSGEAFFAVKKADGNPFTILTDKSKTEVLGTEFNVRDYENDAQVQVTVLEGKVSFSSKDEKKKIFLLPGEKGLIKQNRVVEKIKSEHNNEVAWKTKSLSFENTHLSRVLSTLEEYFGTKITVNDQSILNCRFTGNFNNSDLNEVLEVLSVSVNLTYQKENNSYILKGLGCR